MNGSVLTVSGKKVLTMTEYIERELAIEALSRGDGCGNVCRRAIERILAADVAPVRHGRWINKGEYAVCTECGGRSGTQYDGVEPIPLMTQFCPNCGAKMDGGAD